MSVSDKILYGFTLVLTRLLDSGGARLARKLRSISRRAPEELVHSNIIDFLLYHTAKASVRCVEALREIKFAKIRSEPSAEHLVKMFENERCKNDDEVAHSLLVRLVLEYLEEINQIGPWDRFTDALSQLVENYGKSAVYILHGLTDLLVRVKRVTEAYIGEEES